MINRKFPQLCRTQLQSTVASEGSRLTEDTVDCCCLSEKLISKLERQ